MKNMRQQSIVAGIAVLACLLVGGRGTVFAAKEKNIIKFGRDILIEDGRSVRGAAAVVGNITINGHVEDDVVAVGGSVLLGPKALVDGNVVSIGGIIDKHKKANIAGNMVEANVPGFSLFAKTTAKPGWHKYHWVFRAISLIGFLVLALATAMVVPQPILLVSERIEKFPLHAVSWSIRGLLLIVPLAVILTMSVAGILLIPLEVILVVGASLFGYFAAAQLIGKKIADFFRHSAQHLYLEIFIGVALLGFIGLIPVLGWIVRAIIALLGFGGVLACLFSPLKKDRAVSQIIA